MHLVTGGSGSGKSAYAEQQVLEAGDAPRYYIATMMPYGEEGRRRVEKHRRMRREKHFETIECYMDLKQVHVPPGSTVLARVPLESDGKRAVRSGRGRRKRP